MGEELFIPGYHAVREALEQGRVEVREIWVAEGKKSERAGIIRALAAERSIPVLAKTKKDLESLFPGLTHQGIGAIAGGSYYSDLEYVLESSQRMPGQGLVVAADHITDEGNLASLIRTTAFFGGHGLILPKDRSASLSPRVLKGSSGALVHLPVSRVVNLGRTLDYMDKKGFWIIGTSGTSPKALYDFDLVRDMVLVMGNEQRGLSPSIINRCHEILRIPGKGVLESLNTGVAAGVVLSEICRQRGYS